MIFAALLLAATPIDRYIECLHATATRLESSGEPAGDVAKATVTACRELEAKVPDNSPLLALPPEKFEQMVGRLRQSFTDFLHLRVVRVRACRRTPGCSISSVPWQGL